MQNNPIEAMFGGRYRTVRLLSVGGMGTVYEAIDSLGRSVALKEMNPQFALDQRFIRRFQDEAKITSALQSNHIVKVIDYGIDDVRGPYLVMERLEGENIQSYITRQGRASWTEAKRILIEVGDALATAHAANVIHRDIKPNNVFLAEPGRTVKLLDFGIAKLLALHGMSGDASLVIGTRAWMAPEQLNNQAKIGPGADIWAFGLLAFYLLTGRIFWQAAPDAHLDVVMEIHRGPLTSPSRRVADLQLAISLPRGFDGWFSTCVNHDPTARFLTVADAVAGLRRLGRVTLQGTTPTPAPVDLDESNVERAIAVLRARVPTALVAMRSATRPSVPPPSLPPSSVPSLPTSSLRPPSSPSLWQIIPAALAVVLGTFVVIVIAIILISAISRSPHQLYAIPSAAWSGV